MKGVVGMYKVLCNGMTLHNDKLEFLKVFNAKLTLELGKTGLLYFTIHQDHPYYQDVMPLLATVEVYRNDEIIFRGRVLKVQYGFYNEKQVECEGELAYLLDSIIAPHAFFGSFLEYFDYIVDIHNYQVEPEKQFAIGNRTVPEFWPFEVVDDYNFISSFETLNKRVVEPSGGLLQVRHENGIMYLDLIEPTMDISNVSAQKIKLGKNLIDIKREVEGSEVFSGIVPLGAKINDTENRLDISSVNNGSYSVLNDEAVAAYGKIYRTVIFENITDAATLKYEAERWLAENFAAVNTIEISAADLSSIDKSLDTFKLGQWVEVESDTHFYAPQTFLIRKMTINLSNPADTKIEVGRTRQGLTDSLGNVWDSIGNITDTVNKASQNAEEAKVGMDAIDARVTTLESVNLHVTESGTTGIWKWKKFSDNTCEFFGKVPVTAYDITIALGGWYRGANIYDATAYAYPFAMTEAPAVNMTFQTRNGLAAMPWVFSQDADTAQEYLPQCYLIRPVTGSGIYGNINIIGKGKLK